MNGFQYFEMYRNGMFKDGRTDARYIPKRSTTIKNKKRAVKRKKGKKK